ALACHVDLAAGNIDTAFRILRRQRDARTRAQLPVNVELRGVDSHGRSDARKSTGDQTPYRSLALEYRQHVAGVMPEAWIHLFTFVRQGHPCLHAVERPTFL